MVVQVEDLDDLPVDGDAVRDEDLPAEERGDVLGQHRLAVAGVPEEEEGAAGVDRLADDVERQLLQHQVGHRLAHVRRADAHLADRLRLDDRDVLLEGDGGRAEVGGAVEHLVDAHDALRRDAVLVAELAEAVAPADLDQLLALQQCQRAVHDVEVGQAEDLGDPLRGDRVVEVDRLQHQVGDELHVQPGVLDRGRFPHQITGRRRGRRARRHRHHSTHLSLIPAWPTDCCPRTAPDLK